MDPQEKTDVTGQIVDCTIEMDIVDKNWGGAILGEQHTWCRDHPYGPGGMEVDCSARPTTGWEIRRHLTRNPNHIMVMSRRLAAETLQDKDAEKISEHVPQGANLRHAGVVFLRSGRRARDIKRYPQDGEGWIPPPGTDLDSPVGWGGNPPWTWRDLERAKCPKCSEMVLRRALRLGLSHDCTAPSN